jgi:hypothetical protein
MCWRVWWLNGSSGAPNRAALIVFMPDVLPTSTTADLRRAYPIVAGVSDGLPTHKSVAMPSAAPYPDLCSSIGSLVQLQGRLRVKGGGLHLLYVRPVKANDPTLSS